MALFTDGPLNGLQDLQHYENSILEVAGIEGIDLGAKLSLAQDDLKNQLMLFILRHPLRDMKATIRRSIGLLDVIVTSALKQWHALVTLAAIYRDAYNNQLNDRYLGKWNEYQRLGQIASTDYLQLGVGIVADPIAKAASPILTPLAGAGAGAGAGGSYFVAVSWINNEGQEGAPSDVQAGTAEAGTQLEVAAVNPPPNAANWNIYAGTTASNIALQNSLPIPAGNTWMLPSIVVAGAAPGAGQVPEQFLVHDRLLQRG